MQIIAFDYGEKKIGVAVGQTATNTSSPLQIIFNKENNINWVSISSILDEWKPDLILIGKPLNMDGSEGPRVQASRAFARNLLLQKDQTIVFWDERLSTSAVTRTLIDADMSRAKRANVVDKMAAAYILQGVLDLLNN